MQSSTWRRIDVHGPSTMRWRRKADLGSIFSKVCFYDCLKQACSRWSRLWEILHSQWRCVLPRKVRQTDSLSILYWDHHRSPEIMVSCGTDGLLKTWSIANELVPDAPVNMSTESGCHLDNAIQSNLDALLPVKYPVEPHLIRFMPESSIFATGSYDEYVHMYYNIWLAKITASW